MASAQLALLRAQEAALQTEIEVLTARVHAEASPAMHQPLVVPAEEPHSLASLQLSPEEAMIMGEISGMLRTAPTEALACRRQRRAG